MPVNLLSHSAQVHWMIHFVQVVDNLTTHKSKSPATIVTTSLDSATLISYKRGTLQQSWVLLSMYSVFWHFYPEIRHPELTSGQRANSGIGWRVESPADLMVDEVSRRTGDAKCLISDLLIYKVKVKVRYLLYGCLHESDSWPEAFYNLRSDSWFASSNDAVAHPLPALANSCTRGAAHRHTTPAISHIRPSPRSPQATHFPSHCG